MSNEPTGGASGAGLRERSVGLRGDWIASITNVAPTAATTLTMAALIGASGLASPLALLVAGAAMLCCAVAYHRLNNWQASAAAPVKWVARGLSPIIGFAVGILVLMTALTSNIGNITLIGSTVLSLIAPGETSNKPLTWLVATVICLLVVAIAVIGIKVTIRFEGWVIVIEWVIFLFVCLQGLAPSSAISNNASNVLPFLVGRLGPKGFADLVALAVIASFATTIQSQIVDGSRIMFGMGRDRTVPSVLGRVHPRFRTPVAGLIVMGVIPVLALVLYLASNSLQKTIVYIDSTGGLLFAEPVIGRS